MEKQKTFFTDMVKPFLVLVCICLVMAALLAYVHGVTEPIIEEMTLKRAEETRIAVLPGAAMRLTDPLVARIKGRSGRSARTRR